MAKVAVLLADGFDDSLFRLPYDRLQEAGHDVLILGRQRGACVRDRRGADETWIEGAVESYTADDFDALVIPGGYCPHQRADDDALEFVRRFCARDDKVVAWIDRAADVDALCDAILDELGGTAPTHFPHLTHHATWP